MKANSNLMLIQSLPGKHEVIISNDALTVTLLSILLNILMDCKSISKPMCTIGKGREFY